MTNIFTPSFTYNAPSTCYKPLYFKQTKKKKNKKRKNQKKILLYKFSWRFLRRLAVINRRSQHRYITDTHTHTCILRTVARSAISVYEIKSRREGPRTSKIFFALLLRSPPPRTHVRFRFHSLFSAPNPPPPFSAFFRADDRHIERMQNGLRYIEQIWDMGEEEGGATLPTSFFYRLSLIARAWNRDTIQIHEPFALLEYRRFPYQPPRDTRTLNDTYLAKFQIPLSFTSTREFFFVFSVLAK